MRRKENIVNNPIYIVSVNETALKPVNDSSIKRVIRKASWITLALILITSIILRHNFITSFSVSTKILLALIIMNLFTMRVKKEGVPSPMEIQFFDEYLIIYRPKRYYNEKKTRMEINKIMYNSITRCLYKKKSKRIHIYGDVIAKWYDFDKYGNVAQTPSYDRVVKETFVYFVTTFMDVAKVIKEIEEHSPLKFEIENS